MRTIHASNSHIGWDRSIPPVADVAPGETIEFEALDASGGQLGPDSGPGDIAALDFSKVNPTTGPVSIKGAEPGDVLVVTIEALTPSGRGWTALIPGFGLLAEDFPDPAVHGWTYDVSLASAAAYGSWARVPLRPFPGTIGVAPAAQGPHTVVPPRRVGGNLDVRDLTAGSVLRLPVEVPGALFSVGDTHAAQGDGEVCGTAIESAMRVALRFDLEKGVALPAPQFETAGPVSRHLDADGYWVTTGVGPDLMGGARDAVRAMIDALVGRERMPPEDAYMLCSVCADLRISEIVDAPNWVVSCYFPKLVLAG